MKLCVFFYLPPKRFCPIVGSQVLCPLGSQIVCFLLLGPPSSWPEVGNQILLFPCTWAFQIVFVNSWQSRFFIPFYLGLKTSLAHSWQSSWVRPFFWPIVGSQNVYLGLPVLGPKWAIKFCCFHVLGSFKLFLWIVGSHVSLFPFTWASKHFWPIAIVGSQVGFFLLLGHPIFWSKVGSEVFRFLLLGTPKTLAHNWQSHLCFFYLGFHICSFHLGLRFYCP